MIPTPPNPMAATALPLDVAPAVEASGHYPAGPECSGIAWLADQECEMKRVLIACEYSATVRDAFRARGFDAWSCDLLPTEGDPQWHIQGDAIEAANRPGWDLMVAHPPCTYLTVSGNKWFKPEFADRFPTRRADREEGIAFFMALYDAPIPCVAIENPIGVMSSRFRKPDQVVQPWQYGHGETKATCFWLRGLPKLSPTHLRDDLFAPAEPVEREQRLHKLPPGPDRWKERSRTYQGIADAMADQWGNAILQAEMEAQ